MDTHGPPSAAVDFLNQTRLNIKRDHMQQSETGLLTDESSLRQLFSGSGGSVRRIRVAVVIWEGEKKSSNAFDSELYQPIRAQEAGGEKKHHAL